MDNRDQAAGDRADQQGDQNFFKNCCVWPAVGVVALGIGGGIWGYFAGSDTDTGPTPTLAQYACESHVKDLLKNPKSAEFSDVTSTGGPDTWTVTGTVRGENSFGGTAVQAFTCTADWDDDEGAFYTRVHQD